VGNGSPTGPPLLHDPTADNLCVFNNLAVWNFVLLQFGQNLLTIRADGTNTAEEKN
jgi:hypothetical protein